MFVCLCVCLVLVSVVCLFICLLVLFILSVDVFGIVIGIRAVRERCSGVRERPFDVRCSSLSKSVRVCERVLQNVRVRTIKNTFP